MMVLDHDMNPYEAIEQPDFTFPMLLSENDLDDNKEWMEKVKTLMNRDLSDIDVPAGKHVPMVIAGTYTKEMVEELQQMGEPVQEVHPFTYSFWNGIWMGVLRDKDSRLFGSSSRKDTGAYGE